MSKKQPRAANGRYQEIAHHGYALLAFILYAIMFVVMFWWDQ